VGIFPVTLSDNLVYGKAEIRDIVLFEGDYQIEAVFKVGDFIFTEGIDYKCQGDQVGTYLIKIGMHSGPVRTAEKRIAAHPIAKGEARNRALDDPASASGQFTWETEFCH
jgi:hypothetical protein